MLEKYMKTRFTWEDFGSVGHGIVAELTGIIHINSVIKAKIAYAYISLGKLGFAIGFTRENDFTSIRAKTEYQCLNFYNINDAKDMVNKMFRLVQPKQPIVISPENQIGNLII